MKSLRRHRPQDATQIQEKKETPFFPKSNHLAVQAKEEAPFFQAKLAIGKPGDSYEREADAVADAVVSGNTQTPVVQKRPITPIQRATLATPAEDEKLSTAEARMEKDKMVQEKPESPMPEEEEPVQMQAEEEEEPLQMQAEEEEEPVQMQAEEEEEPLQMQAEEEEEPVQMQAEEEEEPVQMQAEEEEEPLQAKHQSGAPAQVAGAGLTEQLQSSQGNGQPLPKNTRAEMETAFGVDFQGVNVHTDSQSIQMNRELGAQAFTHGSDVYFNSGKFNPETSGGKHLLAHELTHVVQQGSVEKPATVQRKIGDGKDLTAARFSGVEKLEAAFDNETVIKNYSEGTHVTLIQEALVELGYQLPKFGIDGKFDSETAAAVKAFQKDNPPLKDDGKVGHNTMGALDEKFSNGGQKPDVKPEVKPEISDTAEDMGKHVAAGIIKANEDAHTETSGVHYAHNFKADYPHLWKEDYRDGYANPKYWERVSFMHWRLKPGQSASEAVKDWLKGLTIAECLSTIQVIQTDTMRAAIGDAKFDEKFGGTGKALPENQRLTVGVGASSIDEFLTSTDAAKSNDEGTIGNRPANVGDWYYFYNHPQYLLKHPEGAYQGENSIYLGKDVGGNQRWSGLGLNKKTEFEMYEDMAADYNRPRDDWDNQELENIKKRNGGTLPAEYDENSGIFPDQTDWTKVLSAPPYKIATTTRKGGFQVDAGIVLDLAKIKAIRNE